MRNFLSKFLIIFGLACYAATIYFVNERTNPKRVSFVANQYIQADNLKHNKVMPVRIEIPSASISLPVIPAQIKNKEWEATSEGVSFLVSSPLPGEKGNSILYGHNWPVLLGPLVTVKPGDDIQVYFDNNTKKVFNVEYTVTVNPEQTYILAPSKDTRITIYTCTGFMDSKRFVAVALLK